MKSSPPQRPHKPTMLLTTTRKLRLRTLTVRLSAGAGTFHARIRQRSVQFETDIAGAAIDLRLPLPLDPCFFPPKVHDGEMGLRDQFPHSLVPLDLAVLIVQQEVYGESGTGRGVDPNAIATYIAATAPLYELARSAATAPRMLIGVHREAVFRDGGRELAFLDGRPSKYLLAVEAEEVPCVIAMLKEPHRAQSIRSEAVEKKSRRLVQRSRDLRAHHSDLVRDFKALQAYAEQLGRAYHARHDGGQSGRLAP